jgi:hypothetical protein
MRRVFRFSSTEFPGFCDTFLSHIARDDANRAMETTKTERTGMGPYNPLLNRVAVRRHIAD